MVPPIILAACRIALRVQPRECPSALITTYGKWLPLIWEPDEIRRIGCRPSVADQPLHGPARARSSRSCQGIAATHRAATDPQNIAGNSLSGKPVQQRAGPMNQERGWRKRDARSGDVVGARRTTVDRCGSYQMSAGSMKGRGGHGNAPALIRQSHKKSGPEN